MNHPKSSPGFPDLFTIPSQVFDKIEKNNRKPASFKTDNGISTGKQYG
jgi:hypothetical protein